MGYRGTVGSVLPWSAVVANSSPPTIAVFTDDVLVSRLRDALEALGYRTVSAPPAEVTDATALRAFIAGQQLDAVVYDAHSKAVSPSTFQQLYELGVAHDYDVVVAAIYDNPDLEDDDDGSSSQPIGRRTTVEDVVRAVSRAVGPAA